MMLVVVAIAVAAVVPVEVIVIIIGRVPGYRPVLELHHPAPH
jgi:hypothetical protein